MNQPQREKLADLLRGNVPRDVPLIEDAVAHDIQMVEPFIDDLVQQGEIRGKLETLFAIAAAKQNKKNPFNLGTMRTTAVPF